MTQPDAVIPAIPWAKCFRKSHRRSSGDGSKPTFFISIFGENDDPLTSIIILAYLGYQGFDPQPSHSRCPVQCKSVGLPWKQRNESYHFVARSGGTFCGRTPPPKKEKGVWSGGSANICVQQSKRQKKMEDWSQKWDQWPSLQKGLLLSAKNIQPFLDGPWDLAVGCCWAVAHGAHLTDSMCVVCLCTWVLWPNCGKHLTSTSSLVLHFFAAVWMKVESISQALYSCTLSKLHTAWKASQDYTMWLRHQHHSHVLCGMSIHNIHLEAGLCFA